MVRGVTVDGVVFLASFQDRSGEHHAVVVTEKMGGMLLEFRYRTALGDEESFSTAIDPLSLRGLKIAE